IAVSEARRLEIPIVAMTDTNCDPDLIDWVIPANDDAIRSVKLISTKVADAVLEALNERQAQLDQEFEEAEALPPVDETVLAEEADYSAALAAGEASCLSPSRRMTKTRNDAHGHVARRSPAARTRKPRSNRNRTVKPAGGAMFAASHGTEPSEPRKEP